jgi:hypothetical protein
VDVLQNFTLPSFGPLFPGLLDASFQWDNAYLEGGSPLPKFQVQTDMEVLILTADGSQVLQRFNTANANTDEALESIFFLNFVATRRDFAMAFRHVSGPAPTQVKWITFTGFGSDNPNAERQGNATTIFGQPAARGAVAVAAVDALFGTQPESYTSSAATSPSTSTARAIVSVRRKSAASPRSPAPITATRRSSDSTIRTTPTCSRISGHLGRRAHVTAAAALLLHQNPRLDRGDIVVGLERYARDIAPPGRDFLTGFGSSNCGPLIAAATGERLNPMRPRSEHRRWGSWAGR